MDREIQVHLLQQPNELWIYGLVSREKNVIVEQLQVDKRLPVKEEMDDVHGQAVRPVIKIKLKPVKPVRYLPINMDETLKLRKNPLNKTVL